MGGRGHGELALTMWDDGTRGYQQSLCGRMGPEDISTHYVGESSRGIGTHYVGG